MDQSSFNPLDSFDHVVVLMLENRSFDNLLGFLYKPEDIKPDFPLGKKFAGLYFDGPHGNPIPPDAKAPPSVTSIEAMRASNYHEPFPDPGEFYPHVNTQLFDTTIPASNEGQADKDIVVPFNAPDPLPAVPPMTGFIRDYISVLQGLEKPGCLNSIFNFLKINPKWFHLNARYDDYKAIMECFQPDQVPAMATLAREFAVFDHWHCDVPTQTYPNRAFWHSGTSFGYVNNSPMENWILHENGPTLFNELPDNAWNVYTDNPISLTGIVHFHALKHYHETNFKSFKQFLSDAQSGNLPAYSFVEPRFFTPHNDQHPSSYDSVLYAGSDPGAVLLGEKLICDVYNAVKNADSETGNNWKNTLLIITHDEHGGCFDHIPPGKAVAPNVPPVAGQQGFLFDRLGVRVPMIMVSAHIKANTIVNTPHHHTDFLHTMCKKWNVPPFTERDKLASEFTEVFTSEALRDVSDWPVLQEPVIPQGFTSIDHTKTPLSDLQRSMVMGVAHWKGTDTNEVENMQTVGEALRYLRRWEDLPGADWGEMMWGWELE